jgi:hypothetical protein
LLLRLPLRLLLYLIGNALLLCPRLLCLLPLHKEVII